jgi:hypothetical protein
MVEVISLIFYFPGSLQKGPSSEKSFEQRKSEGQAITKYSKILTSV